MHRGDLQLGVLSRADVGCRFCRLETWLSASTEHAFKLARSYAVAQMRIMQLGADKNARHYTANCAARCCDPAYQSLVPSSEAVASFSLISATSFFSSSPSFSSL